MKVAVLGCGYWAAFQVAAWQALNVEIVAVWNRTQPRAQEFSQRFSIPNIFESPDELFAWGEFDIADIIADVDVHEALVLLAAKYKKAVICQKPMGKNYEACQRMVKACSDAGIWYAVHENFRYQPPTLAFKQALLSGVIGKPIRAHLSMRSPDRAILNVQPALTTMPHMVLRDMGPHIFDVARSLFGEMHSVFATPIYTYQEYSVPTEALCTLRTQNGLAVHCDLVHDWNDRFYVEGEHGSIILTHDNILKIVSSNGEQIIDTKAWEYLSYVPKRDWDIHGGHVFSSIPNCLNDLRKAYFEGKPAPTSGEDNLKTMQLVFAAIKSFDTEENIILEVNYEGTQGKRALFSL